MKIKKFFNKYAKEILLTTTGGGIIVISLTEQGKLLITGLFTLIGATSVVLKLLKPFILKTKNKWDDKIYNFLSPIIDFFDTYVALNNKSDKLSIKINK